MTSSRLLTIGFALSLLTLTFRSNAQVNYQQFANKKLYFGITLGLNYSDFKVVQSNEFIYHDSITSITSTKGPGFNLGIISNLKFGEYFDLRFIPALSFAEKNLNYRFIDGLNDRKRVESIYLEFPVHLRYLSQPINDMRLYVLSGMKYGLDFASNKNARKAKDLITISPNDISFEYGFGIQFFFPLFIFSPEIRVSHGLFNIHTPTRDKKKVETMQSEVIEKLLSRTFLISFHFEG